MNFISYVVFICEDFSRGSCNKKFHKVTCCWDNKPPVYSANKPPPPVTDPTYDPWVTLDAIVLQLIYFTIYVDLLTTIMDLDSIDLDACKRLDDLFQDNQIALVVTLEQEFSEVLMDTFSNVSSYCQCLKTLSNTLHDVGAPMNNHCLFLHLISDLIDAYWGVATLLR